MSDAEVAREFDLSVGTVKVYLSHLFTKFAVRNRIQLAIKIWQDNYDIDDSRPYRHYRPVRMRIPEPEAKLTEALTKRQAHLTKRVETVNVCPNERLRIGREQSRLAALLGSHFDPTYYQRG